MDTNSCPYSLKTCDRSMQKSVRALYQPMLRPPSTARICPVTYGASLKKNSAAFAMSSGDSVDPDLGAELACERPREHRESRFGGAVDAMVRERSLRVDVDQVQDQPARRLEVGS